MEGAERAIEKGAGPYPNDAGYQANRASLLVFTGRSAEAAAAFETAFRLDPNPRAEWVMTMLTAYCLEGCPAEVIAVHLRYLTELGSQPADLIVVAAAEAILGDDKAAAATAAQIRRSATFFGAADFVAIFRAPESQALLLQRLTRAGLE